MMSDLDIDKQEGGQMYKDYKEAQDNTPTNCIKCNYELDELADKGVCKFCIRKTFKVSGLINVSAPSYVKVANEINQEAKTYE